MPHRRSRGVPGHIDGPVRQVPSALRRSKEETGDAVDRNVAVESANRIRDQGFGQVLLGPERPVMPVGPGIRAPFFRASDTTVAIASRVAP